MAATLHRWTDADGQDWACAVYDHGPFCRLCQRLDDIGEACLNLVDEGLLDVQAAPDGTLMFKTTATGTARAEVLRDADPELQALWDSAVLEGIERKEFGEGDSGGPVS